MINTFCRHCQVIGHKESDTFSITKSHKFHLLTLFVAHGCVMILRWRKNISMLNYFLDKFSCPIPRGYHIYDIFPPFISLTPQISFQEILSFYILISQLPHLRYFANIEGGIFHTSFWLFIALRETFYKTKTSSLHEEKDWNWSTTKGDKKKTH